MFFGTDALALPLTKVFSKKVAVLGYRLMCALCCLLIGAIGILKGVM